MQTSIAALNPPSITSSPFFAQVVSYDSAAYQAACQLQAERYARACAPRPNAYELYLETIKAELQQVLPLVVRRQETLSPHAVVGTARLELPKATTIEAIMRFQPGSHAASVLSAATFAEIGAFATHPEELDYSDIPDVLDAVAGAIVQLAENRGIEWLWVFPRHSMMSLVLADIPDLLPAYRFTPVVAAGWNEESSTLQKIRQLRMKDLPVSAASPPVFYQITPAQCAEDLAHRITLREARQQTPDLSRLLRAAQRQAHMLMDVHFTERESLVAKENHHDDARHEAKKGPFLPTYQRIWGSFQRWARTQ